MTADTSSDIMVALLNAMYADAGIYAIENRSTGDLYVGRTATLAERWKQHRSLLRRGKHTTKALQQAWNTYGEEAFEFVVLERITDPHELEWAEYRYIVALQPQYNTRPSPALKQSAARWAMKEDLQRAARLAKGG